MCFHHFSVVVGLLYKAEPDGCQHRFTNPAEAKALPHEQASALVHGDAYTKWISAAAHTPRSN